MSRAPAGRPVGLPNWGTSYLANFLSNYPIDFLSFLTPSLLTPFLHFFYHFPPPFLLLFSFFLFFFFVGSLVPRPEIEPKPPAVEAWSLNHWTTGEVPLHPFFAPFLPSLSTNSLPSQLPNFLPS